MLLLLTALLVGSSLAADSSAVWNYIRDEGHYGPDSWNTNEAFPSCAGESNSPIDINTNDVIRLVAREWDLTGWESPHTWKVQDTHFALKFSLDPSETITTQGGALSKAYNVLQFHFHWGDDDTKGSEHRLDGNKYPLEMHIVHWNADYSDVNAALASGDADALAVLGFFFEIQEDDNSDLEPWIEEMMKARGNENYTVDYTSDELDDPVKDAMEGSYYRYFGGLTTPGCNEQVKWTVFETPIGISSAQMSLIRNQEQIFKDEYGVDFYRDPQSIGSRRVTKYDVDSSAGNTMGAAISFILLPIICKFL